MSYQIILNSTGLIFDIAGACLIFRYGLPVDEFLNKRGITLRAIEGDDTEQKKKAKCYDNLSKLGLFLLILGFILQLVSNLI